MSEAPTQLSAKSHRVLQMIADGHSYAQIVDRHPDLNYHDIFYAAEEVIWLLDRLHISSKGGAAEKPPSEMSAMEKAKLQYPRAYAPWTESEDEELRIMHADGIKNKKIADHFQRQPSAIQSRIKKLGLDQS
jgi:DNA-binding NarL/FixJ family response regulator